MPLQEFGERIAVLESVVSSHSTELAMLKVQLKSLENGQQQILDVLAKNKSFLGGMIWLATAMGGAIYYFRDYILGHIK